MRSVDPRAWALGFTLALCAGSPTWADHEGCKHPPNDDLADAAEIPFVPFAVVGATDCATFEPDEPETWCEPPPESGVWSQASVWYRYRPTETSRVTAHVLGVSGRGLTPHLIISTTYPFPSVVHVYQGESFDATKYACDVGDPPLNVSQASFLAVEGKTYYIQVLPVFVGPRGEGHGDFVFMLAPRIETDPRKILP